jgi:hypothetical protein
MHCLHCKEISIYVFPEKKLRGLGHNFHIHVSVSDLYIPTINLPILLQENMWTEPHRHMNVEIGTVDGNSFSGNICFEFSV